jgi:ElaB/YqjD/DUF883 family membrane-anchored ribosome-binding protein
MTSATVDTSHVQIEPHVRDLVIDTARHVAHASHEAQLLKSLAADAVEDGVHMAKRVIKAVTRGVEELGDLKFEAAYRVRRQPLKAVGIAVGVGLLFGMAVGWIGGRFGKRTPISNG